MDAGVAVAALTLCLELVSYIICRRVRQLSQNLADNGINHLLAKRQANGWTGI